MSPTAAREIRLLRAHLPPEAFLPNQRRIVDALAHSVIILGGLAVVRAVPWLGPVAAVIIGHSLACLAFVGHEAAHNAVTRHRTVRALLCAWTLGLNIVPPTMWRRLHNDAHHQNAGTCDDPDRPFLEEEETTLRRWYARLLYPSADSFVGILVFAHFVTYLARNIATVFYPEPHKPFNVPARPSYTAAERWTVAVELVWIGALQGGIYVAVGRDWLSYFWVGPAALVMASGVVMAYVFTNHFLNPIADEHDPVTGTTSVVVPRICDRLHGHFSYHTEHHLFPSMNSDYYPAVSAALRTASPRRYPQLAFGEAWRRLWRQRAFRMIGK
jgi:fatty acid desaturase